MSETTTEFANVWGIHSTQNKCPVMRGWAKSEADAKTELNRIKTTDGTAAEEDYWVAQMTTSQVETFQAMGTLPNDL